jgi:purine-cytosine permease-like protein
MRPKLVVGMSFLAALLGAGSCIGIVLGISSSLNPARPGLIVTATLLLPIAAIIFASFFVYRHTARRRKLQAFVTAILATLLTLSFFVLATILSARRNNTEPPTVTPTHSAN